MSYIRSTANPEGIYIFSDGKESHIWILDDHSRKMPTNTLDKLIKKWIENGEEHCRYRGAEIRESWKDDHFEMVLSYNDWEVRMWYVTWHTIAYGNYQRF